MAGVNLLQRIMFKQEIAYRRIDHKSVQMYVEFVPRKNIFSLIVRFIYGICLILRRM